MDNLIMYIVAIFAGVLPAVFWVWFWNKEDRLHPEPKKVLLLVFLSGMLVVAPTVVIQSFTEDKIVQLVGYKIIWLVMLSWVAIEEILKFLAAYLTILWNKKIVDEPIDAVIYMLTVAFGFAATENILFLISAMQQDSIVAGLLTGNLRFVGANLLHALSSAIVGIFLAFEFYKKPRIKFIATLFGLIVAIIVHFVFNMMLINEYFDSLLKVFIFVWIGLVIVMLLLEKIKRNSQQ